MKNKIFILAFLLLSTVAIHAQTVIKNKDITVYQQIPQEKIYLHHNASFLLTGEYLYYKVYCLNTKTEDLSNFSKIAYVELININKDLIFRHKIRLENGLGRGDFFLPTNIPSGNYKLVAYTQWMRNGENQHFFRSDLSIVNPFQGNQKAILKAPVNDSIQTTEPIAVVNQNDSKTKNTFVSIQTDQKNYLSRNEVNVSIQNLRGITGGNYSLSVRKIDPIASPKRITATNYSSIYDKNAKSKVFSGTYNVFLPELRGELLSGKVINAETNTPADNVKVSISIPGNNYIFKVAQTNKDGIFYFNLENDYETNEATIQVIGDTRDQFVISLNDHATLDYGNLDFYDFRITENVKDVIAQHSIYNQIENAYFSVKPDSINSIKPIVPFFNQRAYTYNLDDYTRFPTVRETMVEIVDHVSIRQKKGDFKFHVRGYDPYIETGLPPLVIVDGLLVQNHIDLVEYNARNIKTVGVVRDKYTYGSEIFDGIVAMQTIDGNYKNLRESGFIKNVTLFKPQGLKNYYKQTYTETNKQDRIPDYRNQLLWKPQFSLDAEETKISFFTSDNKGQYEICLEGFTEAGVPVSLKEIITVQ